MPTASPQRQMLVADFPVLEDRLVHEVRERKARDPFARVRVLVPTQLLRRHLGRVLAERLGGHLNAAFSTLPELVRQWGPDPADVLPALGGGQAAALLAREAALEVAGEGSFYFGPIADRAGFHQALVRTITDMKEALLRADTFDQAIHGGAVDKEMHARKLLSLLGLWRGYERRLSELGRLDGTDLVTFAIGGLMQAGTDEASLAVLYGFYDLNEQQKWLLNAFCGNSDSLVLFPTDACPAFAWTEKTRQWFESAGFQAEHYGHAGAGRRAPELQHLVRRLFARPDGSAAPAAGAVGILSAPGVAREAREIAREVLAAVDADESLRFSDIAIVVRTVEPYRRVLTEVFETAGIPLHVVHPPPLGETPTGKAALLLRELVQRDFPRAKVMEFATGFDLAEGEGTAPVAWDQMTMEAGIVGGSKEWTERLPRVGACRQPGDEDTPEPEPLTERREAVANGLRRFMRRLLAFGEELRAASTFTSAAAAITGCLRDLLAPSAERDTVTRAVDALTDLDVLGQTADGTTVGRALEALLGNEPDTAFVTDSNGVVFADVMAARGTSFRLVFVPGLVEKSFPVPARQDPLLLDHERFRLNNVLTGLGTGGELPEKGARIAEEKLLYRLACGIATERLVVSYPRLDPTTGRDLMPSHFVLRTVEALTGERATLQALEAFPGYVRVPLSRLPPEDLGRSVDRLEFDLGQVERALRGNHAGTALYLKQLSKHFERGVRAERNRWGATQFTAWDGMLDLPSCLPLLGEHALEHEPVSPSALETFGTCPYRYLLSQVFRLSVQEEPERAITISPADRGELIHTILERFHEGLREGNSWPPPLDAEERLSKLTETELDRFAQTGAVGFPLFWELAKQTIREDLRTVLRLEQAEAGVWRPELLEQKYGRDEQATGAPSIELAEGRAVRFSGRIDRVDLDTTKQRARVVDYKTGRKQSLKPDSFAGGTSLQLPLYLIAAKHLLADRKPQPELERAFFWYVSAKAEFGRVEFTAGDWPSKLETLKRILGTFADCVRGGSFFAVPDEAKKCGYCDFALVCGAGKEQVFQRKERDPRAAAYLGLSDIA